MQQSPLYNTRKLSPATKGALESLIGRALHDNETVSVRTYQAHEAPSGEVREAALDGLKQLFAQTDKQLEDVPKEDQEEAIEEALRSVRPTYRPVK
jgi:hypothetical protein